MLCASFFGLVSCLLQQKSACHCEPVLTKITMVADENHTAIKCGLVFNDTIIFLARNHATAP